MVSHWLARSGGSWWEDKRKDVSACLRNGKLKTTTATRQCLLASVHYLYCTVNKPRYCWSNMFQIACHTPSNQCPFLCFFFSRIHLTWENSLCDYSSEKRDQSTLTRLVWVTTVHHNSVNGLMVVGWVWKHLKVPTKSNSSHVCLYSTVSRQR